MNWEALGAIGEIVAAIAVLVTLGYLAAQIRQNTKVVRLTAYDSVVTTGVEVRRSLYENEEVTGLYVRGLSDCDQPSELEQTRFRLLMLGVMQAFQVQYFDMAESGLYPDAWAASRHALRRILGQPGGARFWDSNKHEFPPNFVQEVDRVLSERVTP
jgi:hypothetical protein